MSLAQSFISIFIFLKYIYKNDIEETQNTGNTDPYWDLISFD